MIEAAGRGHIAVIKALLKVETDVDAEAYDTGFTPLLSCSKERSCKLCPASFEGWV